MLKVLAAGEGISLTSWGNDSGLNDTQQAFVYALMKKYNVNRPFVTLESVHGRVTDFLLTAFKQNIVMATYSGLVDTISQPDSGGEKPKAAFDSLVIRAPHLDAFYFKARNPDINSSVVIFFSDPAVFDPLKLKKGEVFYEYPFGNYSLEEGMFGYYMMPLSISKTEQPILPPTMMENLIFDTDVFFGNADFYRGKNPIGEKLPHKRGILLIGPPGNGKSTFIKSYLTRMKDKYGVLIDCSKYLNNGTFQWLSRTLGNRQKVLIFEDCDSICRDYTSRSAFLNFLDGVNDLENTLVIGTTNFPQRLDDAILDRPSRFDSIKYLGKPDVELRKAFLIKWFPELAAEPDRLHTISVACDGYSGAYFKELFLMKGLKKSSIEDALQSMQERQETLRKIKQGELEVSREPNFGGEKGALVQGSIQASLQDPNLVVNLSWDEFISYRTIAGKKQA